MWEIANLKSVCIACLCVPKGCKTICSSFFDAVTHTQKNNKENASKIL